METIVKYNTRKLKSEIKELAEKQRFFKNQRKTEKIKGDRFMSPSEAAWKHQIGRENLRLRYAAYGVMRGKLFSITENKFAEAEHPLIEFRTKIDKIVEEYAELVEVEVES